MFNNDLKNRIKDLENIVEGYDVRDINFYRDFNYFKDEIRREMKNNILDNDVNDDNYKHCTPFPKKELTVEEIEYILGYDIKIIKKGDQNV